ncbi:hypothetical protein CUMW_114380, partial [Citrus unshiu]
AVRVSAPHPADNYHTCSVRRHSTKLTDSKTTTCDPCLGPRKNHYPNPTVTAMSFAVTLSPLFLSPSKPQLHFHNFPKFHPFQKIYPLRASRRSSNFSQVGFSVNGVLILAFLWVLKAFLEVVCTLGTVVFVSILLIRGVWTGVTYLQESRTHRVDDLDDENPAWRGAQPAA